MRRMKAIDLIIYHGGCTDGWCAAWVALQGSPDAETYAATYQEPPPDVRGKRVLVVDFSYPRDVLEQMHRDAAELLVLDHHASAQRELSGMPYAVFDLSQSGAGLAWRTLQPDEDVPWVVRYVEDRDLWRHVLPDSREVSAYLQLQPVGDRAAWDALMGPLVPAHVVEGGRLLLEGRRRYVADMLDLAERGRIGGLDVPVINAPRFCRSELLEALAKGQALAAGWHREASGTYEYSLRSDGRVDVSRVAALYGGGGHPQAAGFRSAELVHIDG